MDGQGTTWRRNIAENFNLLSRAHERYRQTTDRRQTDGRTIAYSEHELEFTFAKNVVAVVMVTVCISRISSCSNKTVAMLVVKEEDRAAGRPWAQRTEWDPR